MCLSLCRICSLANLYVGGFFVLVFALHALFVLYQVPVIGSFQPLCEYVPDDYYGSTCASNSSSVIPLSSSELAAKSLTCISTFRPSDSADFDILEEEINGSISSFLATTSNEARLLVVDDGSSSRHRDVLRYWAAKHPRVSLWQQPWNVGIYASKNACILRFLEMEDMRFLFLADHDITFARPEWLPRYAEALNMGVNHMQYYGGGMAQVPLYLDFDSHSCSSTKTTAEAAVPAGHVKLLKSPGTWGVFYAMSRRAIEVVGGYRKFFTRYGYEHVEYTYRIFLAHLTPFPSLDLLDSHAWFGTHHDHSALSKKEKGYDISENRLLFHAYCYYANHTKQYYVKPQAQYS